MKKRRVLSLLLAFCLVLSLLPGAALAVKTGDFEDVSKDSWYYEDVDFVTSKGYFIGTSQTTFEPETSMTRAMFVTVLARLDGAVVDDNISPFADVPAGTWYSGSVKWAADNGIVIGIGNDLFNPEGKITREDMCVIMDRYIGYYSAKTGKIHEQEGSKVAFPDAAAISGYAKEAVANCRAYGLVNGCDDGLFHPERDTARAQVAAVIHRLAWLVKPEPDPTPVVPVVPATSYTITYWDGDTRLGTASTEVNRVDEKSFTTWAAQEKEGYVFASWNTQADGTGDIYAASTAYTATGNLNLYAQWVADDDYIGIAVMAAMAQANTRYLNGASVSEGGASASVSPVEYNAVIDPADTRAQKLTAQAAVGDDVIVNIIEFAADSACQLLPGLTRAQVEEVVRDIIDEIRDADISADTVNEIVDSVYDQAVAEAQDMWANFRVDGQYVTGDVTVSVGSASFTLTVDQTSGTTSFSGSKKDAAKSIGSALAREMYASLRSNTEWTSEVELTGTVTVTFTDPDNDLALATVEYPHVYPVTVGLKLDGGRLIEYKFDGATSCLKLRVTQAIQTQYSADVERVIAAALQNDGVLNELEGRVQSALNANAVIDALRGELGAEEFDGMLTAAVENWVAANTVVQSRTRAVPNYYLPFEFFWTNEGEIAYDEETDTYSLVIGGETADRQVLGNNAALYDLIVDLCGELADEVIDKANTTAVVDGVKIPELAAYVINKARTTAVTDGVAVPGLPEYIIEKTRTTEVNGVQVQNLPEYIIEEATDACEENFGSGWSLLTEEEQNSYIFISIKATINGSDYDEIPRAVRDYLINVCGNMMNRGSEFEGYTIDGLVYEVIKATLADETYDEIPASLRDYLKMLCGIELGFETGDYTIDGLVYEAIKVAMADEDYEDIPASLRNYLEKLCGVELGLEDADEYTLDGLTYKAINIALDDEEYADIPVAARSYLLQVCGVELGQIAAIDEDVTAEVNDMIDQLVCKTFVGYDRYLNLAVEAKELKNLAGVQLGRLADLLNNATFQNYVTTYGGEGTRVLNALKKGIDKLPAGASVTLNGVTLNAATLDGVKAATSLTEVCSALADVINTPGLRDLSVNSFADGMDITVKYNSRTFTINLTIEVEE